jgi:glutamate--cysteine ligase
MNVVHDLAQRLEDNRELITNWMAEKRSQVPIPIYGSVDIRDCGWKIAVVDANHFPAGFNNVSTEDEGRLSGLLYDHIIRQHPSCKWVHLYPESHTRNPGYVENVATIKRLLIKAGFRCTVGSPEMEGHGSVDGITGPLILDQVTVIDDSLVIAGESPDLVMLNNDLTEGIVPGISAHQVSPPPHMGWQRRRKSEHYACLQEYVNEIAEILDIDPWHLLTDWFVSEDKCLEKETCRQILAAEVDGFLAKIAVRYESLGIDREPVAFVKNDRGTYGLGIMAITSGDQLLNLSNRKFKRLMYSKGGVDVENFLIQEGVPTTIKSVEGYSIEPVVYLIDGEAASWFYRINPKKGEIENLNSPSAKFLPYSEVGGSYGEHAHGWHALVAELSMLAMGAESQKQLVENK